MKKIKQYIIIGLFSHHYKFISVRKIDNKEYLTIDNKKKEKNKQTKDCREKKT